MIFQLYSCGNLNCKLQNLISNEANALNKKLQGNASAIKFIKAGEVPLFTGGLPPEYIFLDIVDVIQLFKPEVRTLQNRRSDGILTHSKIGGKKIFYQLADVLAMFEKYKRTGTKKVKPPQQNQSSIYNLRAG